MHRKIIYIINPISGTSDKSAVQSLIEKQTLAAGIPFFIYPSVLSGDYGFLEEQIVHEEITDVVIAGGDGTTNQVVNHLRKFRELRFGIIPLGSGNGLAFSAGISKNIKKALQVVFKGKAKPTDAFLINKQFACMLCGLGLDAQVAHDFAGAPRRGLMSYVERTIADFIKAKTYSFILHTNNKEIKTEAFFISIANSNQFGNHFKIAPKASLTDGLVDVVIMSKQNKFSVLLNIIKQISGYNSVKSFERINEHSGLIYFQTGQLKISNLSKAPLHIDGEAVSTAAQINIQVIPQCFQLLMP